MAVAGAAVVLAGILLFQPAIVAWGGALLVGLSAARALTLSSVARVRAAGFEMVWRSSERMLRVTKGETVRLVAEVRNRDTRAVRFGRLRVIASPHLAITIDGASGEVPAGGRLEVAVQVRGLRVGRHGLFGLGLELRGSPGLFEVPLTFSNPFGIEVLPAVAQTRRQALRSGGALIGARAARRSGEAAEFTEIRDHQLGDPLKRVAWKASARRGKLLVRKYEVEERELVWVLLDASVELWAGRIGTAPLDLTIDCVSDLARRHLRAGHELGVTLLAGDSVSALPPGRGAMQLRRIQELLATTPATLEPERSGLDERGTAHRVLEHMSALAPAEAARLGPVHLDAIASLAQKLREQAPFPDARVPAATPRESELRSYLAAFGIVAPPRLEPQRPRTDARLAEQIAELARARTPASLLYVASPFPDAARLAAMAPGLRRLQRRRTSIRWLHPLEMPGLDAPPSALGRAVRTAARLRSDTERRASEVLLRRLGVSSGICAPNESPLPTEVSAPEPKGHRAA